MEERERGRGGRGVSERPRTGIVGIVRGREERKREKEKARERER